MLPLNVQAMLATLRKKSEENDLGARLRSSVGEASKRLRPRQTASAKTVAGFWSRLFEEDRADDAARAEIADPASVERAELYSGNIENYIGTAKIPVGLIGPMRLNGLNASGDYFVPMATSEAALVASYGRGVELSSAAGGISTAMISEGVLRTPAFVFDGLYQSGLFVNWIAEHTEDLKAAAEATTRYGKLLSIEPFIDVDVVFLLCRFSTGDAAGQNMVTVATHAMCTHILEHMPFQPQNWFIEANFSGDKKASYLGMHTGRGRKVTASLTVPYDLIRRHLRVEPDAILSYGRVAGLGAVLSGQLGVQAHYANGLAALYIATGQDAACVAESAVGFTRMEDRGDGLFFSVTMPNILVGTVGGGTGLPSQSAALSIMGLKGAGHAAALAEVTAAVCLCGEISITAAIAAGHFAKAHEKLARLR